MQREKINYASMQLYKSLVTPKLEYSNQAWNPYKKKECRIVEWRPQMFAILSTAAAFASIV